MQRTTLQRGGVEDIGRKGAPQEEKQPERVQKAYEGRYEYRTLCCSDGCEIWKFLDQWREGKGQEVEGHLDYEVEGIHEILRNCSMLSVRMGGIYVDDRLEAFSIGSYNSKEKMAIIHIEKANPEMRGLYQMINQQFLIHELPEAGDRKP